ncbi:MAG: oligosaccharide flippase family protein [Hyphomicrobiales bacterium]
MSKNGLFSQASWSLTGQVGYYGLQWMNMIILARLSGPEAVGLYTLGLAIANPIMAVASLMFRLVYATEQNNRWSIADYDAVRWVTLPIGVFAIAAIGFGLGYRELALIVILIAASWKFAETLSDINYAVPHKRGDMRAIALSMIMRAALSSFVLALVLYTYERLDYALGAFSLTWWVCYILIDKRFLRDAEPKVGDATRVDLVRFALPMALSAAVIYLTFSIPRIILDQYEDTATLGIFAAISHLLLVGALAVNSVGAAITPRLSRYFANGEMGSYFKEIGIAIGAAAFVALGFISVAYFAGDLLITLIYGRAIAGQGELVFAMSLASLPMYIGSIIGFVPPALQAYRFHLIVNVITVIGTTAAAFAFIPSMGAIGAVYAVMIQGTLQLLNALILLRRPKTNSQEPEDPSLLEAN